MHNEYRDGRRDRDRERDYRDDYRSREARDYAEYDDSEIREEIDRLRAELNSLKKALEDRRGENADIKMTIKASEQANMEVLSTITQTLEELAARLEEIDDGVNSNIKKVQSGIRDDMDELNLPVEAKCEAIEERIKSIQSDLDYATPLKELMENVTSSVKDSLTEKFGSKNIGDVLQKLSMVHTFVLVDMIGTIMLLVLMAYFIISLT